MDLLCKFCKEPWDNDSLHEEVAERLADHMTTVAKLVPTAPEHHTYSTVSAEFRRFGCGAFVAFTGGGKVDEHGRTVIERCSGGSSNETLSMIYDFMGDDMDGAASMIEDAEHLNLL